MAGVLRRAHLDGLPWSRMAVLVRSTAPTLGPLRRALITAGVPVTVRGADLPLAEQPAVGHAAGGAAVLPAHPTTLTEDSPRRCCSGRSAAPTPCTCAGCAECCARQLGRRGRPAGAGRRSTQPAQRCCPSTSAGRWSAWPACWRPAATARRRGRQRGGRALGDLGRPPAWRAAGSRPAAAGGTAGRSGRPRSRCGGRAVRRGRPLHRPAARRGRRPASPTTWPRQQIPGDALAAPRRQADAVTILTAHASKGLEWDLVCVAGVQEGSWPDLRRRGSLLGSEQLVDLAGRDDAGACGLVRSAAGRGAAAVLRRGHAGAAAGSS